MFNRFLFALGVLSLCGWVSATTPPASPADPAGIAVTGPYTSGNLSVYLVHGPNLLGDKKYLTFTEGLEQKKVIVHEKQQVNELSVENLSDQDLFVQAGEIVKGGQQDRTLGIDMVLGPRSGDVPILAHCVEHGRWTRRGDEAVTQFGASKNSLASKDLKRANYANDQQKVWDSVTVEQAQLASNTPRYLGGHVAATTSPSSLELTVEDKAITAAAATYEKDLPFKAESSADVVGFIFAINGKPNSGDVYASPDLFAKMYPKLLHAAALEAVAEREANGKHDYNLPKPSEAEELLSAVDAAKGTPLAVDAGAMENQINRQANLPGSVTKRTAVSPDRAVVVKKETGQMELYETRDTQTKAAFLHRAYLTK